MTTHGMLLDTLEQDALPDALRARFLRWCVLGQARPALVTLLARTPLTENDAGAALKDADDLVALLRATQGLKRHAGELVRHGKTGTAAAAALFEFDHLLRGALDPTPDPTAGAFFAARVCGWAALVHNDQHHPLRKQEAEARAHHAQEAVLRSLLAGYARSS